MTTVETNIIRIVIVDDRQLIRQALQIYLEAETDLNIVGFADNGTTAIKLIGELAPDVVILDLEMPGINGLTTLQTIRKRFPEIHSLVLSAHDEQEYINRAIKAGAKGYLLKGTPPQEIAYTLRRVNKGYFQLGSGLLEKFIVNLSANPIVNNPNLMRDRMSRLFKNFKTELRNQSQNIVNRQIELTYSEFDQKIGSKIHSIKIKQAESNFSIEKLQQKFNILLTTQIILFFMFAVIYFLVRDHQ